MSDEPAAGEEADASVPDAVLEWLGSAADERGVSESELLRSLLADRAQGADVDRELERLEQEFQAKLEDVRDRVIQVKRETDGKAPADHAHDELRSSIEQLSRTVRALQDEVETVDQRLDAGFENYEDVLTYLVDTTDTLDRRLTELARAVLDLRDRADRLASLEARQAALAKLTAAANRHGVSTAKCEDCGASVDLGLLAEPRCPQCDAGFADLEAKSGFLRTSVLHTGSSIPALESAPDAPEPDDTLAALAEEDDATAEAPSIESVADSGDEGDSEMNGPAVEATGSTAASAEADAAADTPATSTDAKADGDLTAIDGIGPAYADRLREAGVIDLPTLAEADPEELGETIDVHAWTVADWVEQAAERTGHS
ncbi:MAG: helix-hairpin-helix domain-containing protein [Halobacteriales archaeon]